MWRDQLLLGMTIIYFVELSRKATDFTISTKKPMY